MLAPDNSSLSKRYAFWRAVGQLEGTVEVLLENQRELRVNTGGRADEGQAENRFNQQEPQPETQFSAQESRAETDALIRGAVRRLDQCFYVVLVGGSVLIALMFALRFI